MEGFRAKNPRGGRTTRRVEIARREREHSALLETAQKALANTEAERDDARADFDSLEDNAAKVVLAYRYGDKIELDEAVESLASNGRPKWWEKSKPIGLRGESDD